MIQPSEALKLLDICATARECEFLDARGVTKAVSVARRDRDRQEVLAILKGQETLWPPGACNCGMTMWVQQRTWYPFERSARDE